jgi:hypothetical protein
LAIIPGFDRIHNSPQKDLDKNVFFVLFLY